MIKETTPGFVHLSNMKPFCMDASVHMSQSTKLKVDDTVRYVMETYPDRDPEQVRFVSTVSLMAEQHIASYTGGTNDGAKEDLDDPYTYAYDVALPSKYQGLRLEVKCSLSGKWINIKDNKDYPSRSGINLYSFRHHRVADCIIILSATELDPGVFEYTPKVLTVREAFNKNQELVVRGRDRKSWYLRKERPWSMDEDIPLKLF